MNLAEMIPQRKSFRSFTEERVEEATRNQIRTFFEEARRLDPDIPLRMEFVEREQVKCILPFIPPQCIAIYSDEKEGLWENIGFVFQQLDLYLQSMGLGSCWLGLGKLPDAGEEFRMLLAFGYSEEGLRTNKDEFKRKTLSEIADREDERLEPVRLAPSAINNQPWYFVHDGEKLHVYCSTRFLRARALGNMILIDMGIALAHLYVSNPETFSFWKEAAPEQKGLSYIGTIKL